MRQKERFSLLAALAVLAALLLLVGCALPAPSIEKGAWFGRLTPPNGEALEDLRFEIAGPDRALTMAFAPYGETPLPLEDVRLRGDTLSFTWPEPRVLRCSLMRQPDGTYQGECLDAQGQPWLMALTTDWPLCGKDLEPSEVDVRILRRAAEILHDESAWNRADERVCEDDESNGSWSLFCALYRASLDVTGEYLHRRPAMEAVRWTLQQNADEGQLVHLLRDYNNLPTTTFEDIQAVLQATIERLDARLGLP